MKKLLLLCVLLGAVLMIVTPSMAITPPTQVNITNFDDRSGDCGLTAISGIPGGQTGLSVQFEIFTQPVDQEGAGFTDQFQITVHDSNNTLLGRINTGVDFAPNPPQLPSSLQTLQINYPNQGSAPTSRPWVITIQDTNNDGTVINESFIFDPADYAPACASLPFIGIQEADPIPTINTDGSANEVSIYPSTDENGAPALNLYDVDEDGNGTYALTITQDDIAPFDGNPPSENTEILTSDNGNIRVFVLDTGEIQVNSGPDEEGKIHVVIMDGIPPTSTYGYTIDPPSAE